MGTTVIILNDPQRPMRELGLTGNVFDGALGELRVAIWIPPVMGVKNDILPATQNKRYV